MRSITSLIIGTVFWTVCQVDADVLYPRRNRAHPIEVSAARPAKRRVKSQPLTESTPILHEYYVGCGGKKQRGGKKIAAASSKGGKKFGEGNGTVGKKQNVRRARRRTQVDPLVNQDLCPDDFDLSFSLSMSLPVVPPTGPIESEPGAGSASGSNSDSGDDTGGDFSLDDDDAITPPTDDSNVGGTIIPDLPWLDFADDDFTVPSNDDESPSNDPF